MITGFPAVRAGEPVSYRGLTIVPLFDGSSPGAEYLLLDDGLASGSVTVEEISEAGSVPDLLVENKGDVPVLLLEGEELVGAKQNRVLNTSVLIAARTRTKIPVSCVEQGRWAYSSRGFSSSGRQSPSRLRYSLKSSVSNSLSARRGHRSDQMRMWQEVRRQQVALAATSDSEAMADTFVAYQRQIAEYHENLKYVAGATGMAVAIGPEVVAMDIFDKPVTCEKVWDRMMSGYVLDAIEREAGEGPTTRPDVKELLRTIDDLAWQEVETVGEGEEYRAQMGEEVYASVLALHGAAVHANLIRKTA